MTGVEATTGSARDAGGSSKRKLEQHAPAPEAKGKQIKSSAAPATAAVARSPPPELPSSALSFSDVQHLKHVVVAHFVAREPEVMLWHADMIATHPDRQTCDVRLREWTLLLQDVAPNRIFRPSASLPAV